jgi:hypothetical protein
MMGVQRFFLVNDRSSDNYQGSSVHTVTPTSSSCSRAPARPGGAGVAGTSTSARSFKPSAANCAGRRAGWRS